MCTGVTMTTIECQELGSHPLLNKEKTTQNQNLKVLESSNLVQQIFVTGAFKLVELHFALYSRPLFSSSEFWKFFALMHVSFRHFFSFSLNAMSLDKTRQWKFSTSAPLSMSRLNSFVDFGWRIDYFSSYVLWKFK